MPYPQSVTLGVGGYTLIEQVFIDIQGMSDERHHFIVERITQQLQKMHHEVISQSVMNDRQNIEGLSAISNIRVLVNQGKKNSFQLPQFKQDESYQLTIDQHGIELVADTDFGALQGIATLWQLIASQTNIETKVLPYMVIKDFPRFPWRGLMIDSVRHFLSVETIKRQIDGMAAAKLNVFHWHLTDDQGWRFESKAYPKLHQMAADGQYYSQQEIKDVVKYAALLGIRVVPEFDVPGHASAIAVAYPELITEQKDYQMEDQWGVFEPLLDPSNSDTYLFIDKIIAELTGLFPDHYLHIGGDEVDPTQWQSSEKIQQYMQENKLKNSHDLQLFFNGEVQKILTKYQRKMMGWDEIYHPNLAKDIMVQSWRGMESLSQIAANDYQGLLSTGFYIDQPQSTAYHYRNDPLAKRNDKVIDLGSEDVVEAWRFSMPRLKGSAVIGTLVMVKRNDYLIHAYVKLNNNHFKKVQVDRRLTFNHQQINFTVDSWMGPTRGEFELSDPLNLSGRVLIGNSHYDVKGAALNDFDFSSIKLLANLSAEQEKNIVGGEATLWTELVTEHNVDLRTWPRTFAIAERFWSAKSLSNIDDMYQRLMTVDDYSAQFGLQHQMQHSSGLQRLVFPKTDISPLVVLAEQLEPANYYTRHHLMYLQERYHQNAILNSFADYLPVESLQLVNMHQQLKAYKKGDKSALQAIVNTMRRWHYNFDDAVKVIRKNPKLSTLVKVVDEARQINTIGLTIAQSCLAGVKIREIEAKRVTKNLRAMHSNVRATVIASGLLVENILDVCRK